MTRARLFIIRNNLRPAMIVGGMIAAVFIVLRLITQAAL